MNPTMASVTLTVTQLGVTEENKEVVCTNIAHELPPVGDKLVTLCSLTDPDAGDRRLLSSELFIEVDVPDAETATNAANADDFMDTVTLPQEVVVNDVVAMVTPTGKTIMNINVPYGSDLYLLPQHWPYMGIYGQCSKIQI